MGATAAALTLMSHPLKSVQINAARLLLTLLQGCNRDVQRTAYKHLRSHHDTLFFQHMRGAIDAAIDALKDFKKSLHRMKQKHAANVQNSAGGAVYVSEASSGGSAGIGDELETFSGFGRQSYVLLALRLIQLMCEGQYAPMQDLVVRLCVSVSVFVSLHERIYAAMQDLVVCLCVSLSVYVLLHERIYAPMHDLVVSLCVSLSVFDCLPCCLHVRTDVGYGCVPVFLCVFLRVLLCLSLCMCACAH